MSLEDFDEVPEAKSPFSKRATETPRRARSRAMPAPAMPPPITTALNGVSSMPASRLWIMMCSRQNISDGSYHVVRSEAGDSGVVGPRDPAQHENGGESPPLAHRHVGLDAIAHHHRVRRAHAEGSQRHLEDDGGRLPHDGLHPAVRHRLHR